MTLKNRLVMITGASAGIGEACAEAFAREGCRLVLAARRGDAWKGSRRRWRPPTARRRTCWNWTCATAWP
ncbi:MAG: SDR family NAD(P)-dependent oxidoreductase [bacterium]|nr:SDR family NAD(P)-dependent oxidoreductase [bacterium]